MFRAMQRLLSCFVLAFFCLSPGPTANADETPATAVVEALHDSLIVAMKEAATTSFDDRSARLGEVIAVTFDMRMIARISMGRYWKSFDQAQQEDLTDALRRLTVATYAGRFDDYSGESFRVLSEESAPRGTIFVKTELVKSDGDIVRLNYLMRSTDDGWRIVDVYFKAKYSELAVRRSEYTSVYKRVGLDGLIAAIEQKIESYNSVIVK